MIQSHQTSTGMADTHGSLSEQSQSWHGRAQHGGNLPSTTSLQQEEAQDLLLHTQTTGLHTEPTAVSTASCMVSVATVSAHRGTQGSSQQRAVSGYEERNTDICKPCHGEQCMPSPGCRSLVPPPREWLQQNSAVETQLSAPQALSQGLPSQI